MCVSCTTARRFNVIDVRHFRTPFQLKSVQLCGNFRGCIFIVVIQASLTLSWPLSTTTTSNRITVHNKPHSTFLHDISSHISIVSLSFYSHLLIHNSFFTPPSLLLDPPKHTDTQTHLS